MAYNDRCETIFNKGNRPSWLEDLHLAREFGHILQELTACTFALQFEH